MPQSKAVLYSSQLLTTWHALSRTCWSPSVKLSSKQSKMPQKKKPPVSDMWVNLSSQKPWPTNLLLLLGQILKEPQCKHPPYSQCLPVLRSSEVWYRGSRHHHHHTRWLLLYGRTPVPQEEGCNPCYRNLHSKPQHRPPLINFWVKFIWTQKDWSFLNYAKGKLVSRKR